MTTDKVQARINVKSENFEQVLEEPVVDSKTYDELIAANERLRLGISKIFTEFVNKARLEQETNGDNEKKKRKLKQDDDEEEQEENENEEEEDNDDEDDQSSDEQ